MCVSENSGRPNSLNVAHIIYIIGKLTDLGPPHLNTFLVDHVFEVPFLT